MSAAGRSRFAGLLWVLPWLIGLCVFFLAPMGLGAYYSMTDYTMLEPPLWVGLDNDGGEVESRLIDLGRFRNPLAKKK